MKSLVRAMVLTSRFFFEEEIACQQARNVGKRLLELAMQESKDIRFSSFDRMFPNQDILPKGGFGNLIALPLQGEVFKKGRTVFVDKHFQPFSEQWFYLQQVQKIGQKKILDFLGQEFSDSVDDTVLVVAYQMLFELRRGRFLQE